MSFRSFQARLLVFFLGLLLVVQVLVFLVVNAATTQETRAAMMEDLAVGSKVFGRLIASPTHPPAPPPPPRAHRRGLHGARRAGQPADAGPPPSPPARRVVRVPTADPPGRGGGRGDGHR